MAPKKVLCVLVKERDMFKIVSVDPGTINLGIIVLSVDIEKDTVEITAKRVTRIPYIGLRNGNRPVRERESAICRGLTAILSEPEFSKADMAVIENQNFGMSRTNPMYNGIQWAAAAAICANGNPACEVWYIDSKTKFKTFKDFQYDVVPGKSKRTTIKDKSLGLAKGLLSKYCIEGHDDVCEVDHLSDAFGLALAAVELKKANDRAIVALI